MDINDSNTVALSQAFDSLSTTEPRADATLEGSQPSSRTRRSLPKNVTYDKTNRKNAHILKDCSMQAVTFQECHLENVIFTNCRFFYVKLQKVKLKNVIFSGVTFSDVLIKDIDIKLVNWKDMSIARACITPASLTSNAVGQMKMHLSHRNCSKLSKTSIRRFPSTTPGTLREVEVLDRTINLLGLPKPVMEQIFGYLFPRRSEKSSTIIVQDRAYLSIPRPLTYCKHNGERVTYQGTWSEYPDGPRFRRQPLDFSMNVLLVSKQCYELAVRHVYDRPFRFDNAKACLAFLHDHKREEHQIPGFGLKYNDATDPATWRRLFNVLVHERRDPKEFVLDIGAELWLANSPDSDGKAALKWRGWVEGSAVDMERSILQHVARLSGRRLGGGKLSPKVEDVRFFLRIAGAEGNPSREAFVARLQTLLRKKMLNRPDLSDRGRLKCCKTANLEECCYWQRPGSDK